MICEAQGDETAVIEGPALLTVQDVTRLLAVSNTTVYELCAAGKLAYYRIGAKGGRYRFTRADVDAYLEKQRVTSRTAVKITDPRKEGDGKRLGMSAGNGLSLLRQAGYKG